MADEKRLTYGQSARGRAADPARALFILFFMVLPLITIVVYSFWRTESYTMIPDWNIENYTTVLTQKTYLTFIGRSLLMSVSVSFVCLLYSWPVAYFIAKYGGAYRLILVLLTAAPFFTRHHPPGDRHAADFRPIGVVNMFLTQVGLQPVEALMYTNFATAIGLVYLWIPFMVLAIYLSLLNFDFQLLEAAMVNGAGPWRSFWEITWPLNWIGTAIGLILVFIPTFAAAITPRFLGGVNGAMYGNILEHQFGATGTWALGRPWASSCS